MAARKQITEITITGGVYAGTMSLHCPHASGTVLRRQWLDHLLDSLLQKMDGSPVKVFTAVTDSGNYHSPIQINRGDITAIEITLG